jgi:nucleoid-associated protein YgaU
LPELNKLAAEMANTPVRFLAVSLDADTRRVRVAMESLKLTLPVATPEAELLAPLDLESVPSTIFIDASGKVVAKLGISSKAELKEAAMALLTPAATASRAPSAQAAATR